MCFRPCTLLEASATARRDDVDSVCGQPVEFLFALCRINRVDDFVATRQTVFDEWQQQTKPLVRGAEERADMSLVAQNCTAE